jgi:hypothetical protein
MSRAARPLGQAMYIDTEEAVLWLQSVQRRLYALQIERSSTRSIIFCMVADCIVHAPVSLK